MYKNTLKYKIIFSSEDTFEDLSDGELPNSLANEHRCGDI